MTCGLTIIVRWLASDTRPGSGSTRLIHKLLLRVVYGGFVEVAGVAVKGGKLGGLDQRAVRNVLFLRIADDHM